MFRKFFCFCFILLGLIAAHAQSVNWGADGSTYYKNEEGNIVKYTLPQNSKTILVPANRLTPSGSTQPIDIRSFVISKDESKVLIYNNTRQVWREDTRGDYWVLDLASGRLQQLGKGKPEASLMFAKLSPDNTKVAYVSEYNLYVEDLASGAIKALTTDGNRKNINGTFDWAYEEEFFCRDGFRWAPDSKKIAYWKIIAGDTKVYNMVNNTDSIYPKLIPIEYPVAGEKPSVFKIGVVSLSDAKTKWMNIADDAVWGSYVPRMEWAGNTSELIVQHLNRRQNESNLILCNTTSGAVQTIYTEKDSAWIDIVANWDQDYTSGGWDWLNGGKEFLWPAEKDGWRHLYRVSRDGKRETLVTKGKYDVMDIAAIDEKEGYLYFHASPENATQKYLYRTKLNGAGNAERLTPADYPGTNSYNLSPGATYAVHSFSNYYTRPSMEWITVADHKPIGEGIKIDAAMTAKAQSNVEFITVTTEDGVQMDAWMAKPANFDTSKKYPVVFYVYTEPWGQTVKDSYGAGRNFLYKGDMAKDGYIYVSIDSRGTPVPKGRTWRKALYKNIGILNIHDQAMAAKALLKQYPYLDGERTAVWGWSGGGSTTLNLMFQFPEIYKTGIAVAAVGNQRTYDNIYQERYSGIPQQDETPYIKGSPVTHAKNLKGNLLYIHGTGDDNVHYNNAEMLFNELIKYNRQFQMMSYPNRSHSIAEGEGTSAHLQTLYTNYLRQYCPPGAK